MHINYEDEFNFLQICRITEKNCINNDGETDFLYAEMFSEEISETEMIEKIHIPLYNDKVLLNFKFEKNGIFAGYFVKPSFTKDENGNISIKKDKEGKEIILGIKMKYEQKNVLSILKEMHLELIAKKKIADVNRLNFAKEMKEKEKAEAKAKAEAEKEAKTKAEAEAKAIKAKAKAEAEAKAKAEKAEAKKSLSLLTEKEKAEKKEKAINKRNEINTKKAEAEAEAKKIEIELIHS